MKKKIFFIIIILLIALGVFFFLYKNRKVINPIENLSTTDLYIINGDINRAEELLNNYDYVNGRKLPNHKGLISKERYTYYDNTNHEVIEIAVMDYDYANECIIEYTDGQRKYFDMKKKETIDKKYSVSLLTLDPQKGEEEEVAYKFLNLINDNEESFQYDLDNDTTIDLLYKANKSVKVENITEVRRFSEESDTTYSDTFSHELSIYSYDTEAKAKQVYEKYIKDLYKYCDTLSPNQIKTRSFEMYNEHYLFIYDNDVYYARGIIGTNGNKMFMFNFRVNNIENNKDYTGMYFDLLNETGYIKTNEIKDFVLNLFVGNNLNNKANYDN